MSNSSEFERRFACVGDDQSITQGIYRLREVEQAAAPDDVMSVPEAQPIPGVSIAMAAGNLIKQVIDQ